MNSLQFFAAPAPTVLLLAACIWLTSCASTQSPAARIVEVPAYVPCVKDRPIRPAYEFGKLTSESTDGEKILALARDWPRGRKYEGELEAALAGCLDL